MPQLMGPLPVFTKSGDASAAVASWLSLLFIISLFYLIHTVARKCTSTQCKHIPKEKKKIQPSLTYK